MGGASGVGEMGRGADGAGERCGVEAGFWVGDTRSLGGTAGGSVDGVSIGMRSGSLGRMSGALAGDGWNLQSGRGGGWLSEMSGGKRVSVWTPKPSGMSGRWSAGGGGCWASSCSGRGVSLDVGVRSLSTLSGISWSLTSSSSGMSWGFSSDGSGSEADAESDTLSSAEEEESAVVSERSSEKEPGTGAELERGAAMVMVLLEVEVETERETDWAEGLGGSSKTLGGDGGRKRTREGLGDGLERKGREGRPRWAMSLLKRRRTRRRPTSYQKKGAMSAKTRPRAVQSTTRAIL